MESRPKRSEQRKQTDMNRRGPKCTEWIKVDRIRKNGLYGPN